MSEEAARPEGPALAPCPHCGGDHPPHILKCTSTDMPLPLEGRTLHGKFELVRQLGKGGMAAVWSAVNTLVDRRVAIKIIRPDAARSEETVARFRSEAKAAGRIGHRNVCEILDFGLGPLGPYIVMERLRGKSLGQLIRDENRLDPALAATIARQALAGLEAAHKCGIIHRDLKPENVFVHQPEGGPPVVKLMDFGVSKLTDGSSEVQTGHGTLLGTPEYMSPEQFKGAIHADVRTDIWAMGAILYKALTGQTAFGGPSVAGTLLMVTTEEPTPIPELVRGVPPEMVAIVERCLAKDPEDRWQSAQALADELEAFDLETLDAVVLVDDDEEPEAPSPPTVNVSPQPPIPVPGAPESPVSPASSAETLLPTTRPRVEVHEPRHPDRPDRRAWLLIGGVTLVGAGVLAWLSHGPERAQQSSPQAMVDATQPSDPAAASTTAPANQAASTTATPLAQATSSTSTGLQAGESSSGSSGTTGMGSGDGSTGGDTTGGDPSDTTSSTTDAPEPSKSDRPGPRPAIDPSQPLPVPSGTVRVDRYLAPKKPGPAGTHAEAKAYCRGLAQRSFAGVSTWKQASPIVARKLARAVRRGKYWTAALWKGKAIVVNLPSAKQSSRDAEREGPRALCSAKWP